MLQLAYVLLHSCLIYWILRRVEGTIISRCCYQLQKYSSGVHIGKDKRPLSIFLHSSYISCIALFQICHAKAKNSNRCSFVWAAAGKQSDLEKQVGVGGYGYPAFVALNVKKGAYAPLKGAFEKDHIM